MSQISARKLIWLGEVAWTKIDYGHLWNAINYQKHHSKYAKEATVITINYENILSAFDGHQIGRQKQKHKKFFIYLNSGSIFLHYGIFLTLHLCLSRILIHFFSIHNGYLRDFPNVRE